MAREQIPHHPAGRLSERFESAVDGMALESGPNQAVLAGDVRDQAHLHRVPGRLRDVGIGLLAVSRPAPPASAASPARRPAPAGENQNVSHSFEARQQRGFVPPARLLTGES